MAALTDSLQKLLDITVAQGNLIRTGNADALGRNLERRQCCLNELEAALKQGESANLSPQNAEVLAKIQTAEEQNMILMDAELENTRNNMRKNTEARKIAASYAPLYKDADNGYNKSR